MNSTMTILSGITTGYIRSHDSLLRKSLRTYQCDYWFTHDSLLRKSLRTFTTVNVNPQHIGSVGAIALTWSSVTNSVTRGRHHRRRRT